MKTLPTALLTLPLFLVAFSLSAAEPDPEYVINDDFENWIWKPISFGMRKEGRERLTAGKPLGYEYRGPLYLIPVGFELPGGIMIEGSEAFEGRSMMLTAGQAGLHGRYSRKIMPRTTYSYELAVKGAGTFHFRAWVHGRSAVTGETKWLDFPNLIEVELTDTWQTYSGTYRLPDYDETTFKVGAISAAIVIEVGDKAFVDNFRVREADPQ
jgi:hypothetical protein